ncbi:4Fe-4S dicluster domain-containing protein [Heliobacterium undosum]|uniref:4Fe-4S dicluster domain-containing protein n=1 Tax=Heliomicrobium undosum TaxID=121734 RepID=A0A845L5T5_9FIRM|nr:4Fe-4S binding protein [Heliomicrobium undosum]MZP30204.1 4Fe-4S dicluster domain-containing protein [Heliomicrobium undosum]
MVTIDYSICDRMKGCPPARRCPVQAIIPVGGGGFFNRKVDRWEIDESKCTGCGICIRVCPQNAISKKPKK